MSYRQQTTFGGSVSIGVRHWLGEGQQHTGLYRSRESEAGEDMSTKESYGSILGGFIRPESGKRRDDSVVNKAVTTKRGPVMDRETRKAFLRQMDDEDDDDMTIEGDGVGDVLPLDVESTPVHGGTRGLSSLGEGSPQVLDVSAVKSMNKHLDGMFDAIMKEMFSPEMGGKALSFDDDDDARLEEDFTIMASPSPRKKHVDSQRNTKDENVVLDMGNASPLLRRMREIEERKKNIMPVPSSPAAQAEQTTQDKDCSEAIEMLEEGRVSEKGVAPLVHYFETGGAQKPPLPGIGHHLRLSYAKLKKQSPTKIVRVLEDTIVPYVLGKRKVLYNVGKPRLWAVAAIAYIVLIHLLLIGTKLHRQ